MTKAEHLEIIKLLSALESWSFAEGKRLPDYLIEQLNESAIRKIVWEPGN